MNWAVPRIMIVARFRIVRRDYLIRSAISDIECAGVL